MSCAKEIKTTHLAYYIDQNLFVFVVDADDLIHYKVVQFANQNQQANGFKSRTGYRWISGKKHLEVTPYFGGSMNILKLKLEELPDELPDETLCFDKPTCAILNEKYPVRWTDHEIEGKFKNMDRPLTPLSFRSTIYLLGTGINISGGGTSVIYDHKRIHLGVLLFKLNPFTKRRITKKIKSQFAIY